MTIKELRDGNYEVSYSVRHPKTRRPYNNAWKTFKENGRRKVISTMAMAKRAERALILQTHAKFDVQIRKRWGDFLLEFLDLMQDNPRWGVKTFENYKLCLNKYTIPLWEERFMEDITTKEIRSLMMDKLSDKSNHHKKSFKKHLNAVFKCAVEEGHIQRNPVPDFHFKTSEKNRKVLTEMQASALLKRAKEMNCEWYPHWAMAVYTGMRNGELYALTWDKVNLEQRTLLVDCSWSNKEGYKSTKSGDDRVVEIAPALLTLLKQLKLQSGDSEYVLPRLTKWDKGEQARELRRFLQGMGMPVINFHDLRATWATIMMGRGIEPYKVACMAGWKDLKTMNRYVREAGVFIKGITDDLELHDPNHDEGKVLNLIGRNDE